MTLQRMKNTIIFNKKNTPIRRAIIMFNGLKPTDFRNLDAKLTLSTTSLYTWVRRVVLASSLLVATSLYAQESGQQAAALTQPEQLLNEFVNGRELPSGALEQAYSSNTQAAVGASNTNASNLVRAQKNLLVEFESTLGQPQGILKRASTLFDSLPQMQDLQGKVEELNAQHLLYLAHFEMLQSKLVDLNASAKHLDRLNQAKAEYQSKAVPLIRDLQALVEAESDDDDKSLLQTVSLQQDLHSLKVRLQELSDQAEQAQPILRFSSLPFQALALAPRDLVLEPKIVPSYANIDVLEPTLDDSKLVDIEPQVRDLAEQLGHDPIRLYEYVHSTIQTRWYAGSMLSPGAVIAQGEGNSVDQAALLSALMRASSIPTRFVNGVVKVPSRQLLDMTAVDDLNQALGVLQRAGVAHQTVVEGGQTRFVLIEQTWLSVYVPYTNYRGASLDRTGEVWLGLMPSIKTFTRDSSGSKLSESDFSVEQLKQRFLASVQSQDVVQQLRALVEQLADSENQLDIPRLIAESAGYLPNTLPLAVEAVTSEASTLSSTMLQNVRFIAYRDTTDSDLIMDVNVPVSELGNQNISLSYQAGSQDDHDLILSLGGLSLTPLYLVDLRPQIKVNGVTIAVAEGVLPAGVNHKIGIEFNGPVGRYRIDKLVRSGNYHGIGITAQNARLQESTQNRDTSGGQILSQIALRYLSDWSESEQSLSEILKRRVVQPLPNLVFASNDVSVNVESVLGQPLSFNFRGVNLDAALRVTESLASRSDAFSERDFATLSALQGSYLEHALFERTFGVESVSADKGIALMAEAGQSILRLTSANLSELDTTLTAHSSSVIESVRDWLQLGFEVTIPTQELSYIEWSGSVWIVNDTLTGEAGYYISRGLAGGATVEPFPSDIGDALADPTSEGTIFDDSQAASITLSSSSNFQVAAAGEEYSQLVAHVRDVRGLPVAGAKVVFDRVLSTGEFVLDDETLRNSATSVSALTDLRGVARVTYRAPEGIADSPDTSFILVDNGDANPTQVAINYIEVSVEPTGQPVLRSDQLFTLITIPGAPARIFHDVENGTGLIGIDNAELSFDEIFVHDEFGNAVANVDVLVQTGEVRPERPIPPEVSSDNVFITPHRIATPDCEGVVFSFSTCGATSIMYQTNSFGFVSVGIIFGEIEADFRQLDDEFSGIRRLRGIYPIISSIGDDKQVELEYEVSDLRVVFNFVGPGRYAATQPGGTYLGKGYASSEPLIAAIVEGDRRVERMEALEVTMELDDFSGSATFTNTSPASFDGGADIEYTNMVVGEEPGHYKPLINWSYLGDASEGEGELFQRAINPITGSVAALKITPDELQPLEIPKDLLPQRFGALTYKHEPADYEPFYEALEIFEDSTLIATVIGKDGEVNLPPIEFELDKTYRAEIVYNRGSEFNEVRSERFELPINAPVIARAGSDTLTPRAGLVSAGGGGGGSIIIDRVNEVSCTVVEPTFSLDLVQDAMVTIETFHPNFSSPRSFITRRRLDAGLHEFDVGDIGFRNSFLREGVTDVFITAESISTGRIDTLESRFSFSQTDINVLPVGSPIYEDVNLWNGSLFLSKTDLQVPDRGPNLEFTRSYSSGNSAASSLGPGWSHNYDSYARLTHCGWVTVSGGVAGGVTFFPQPDGSYLPGRGYHSSLERTPEGDWDFFAKDGTRYHYSQRFRINLASVLATSSVYLEYIEDTNGNRTTLSYSETPHRAPQLESVKDSSGRQIQFEYRAVEELASEAAGTTNPDGSPADLENIKVSAVNRFYEFSRNVITRVTGVDYDIDYRYDENGRLVEATNYVDRDRSNAAPSTDDRITEIYQYQDITDITPEFRGLSFDLQAATAIQAVTDPRGIKTDYKYVRRNRELLVAFNGNETTLPYLSDVVQVAEISKANELNLPGDDIVSTLAYIDRTSSNELPRVEVTDPRGVLYNYTMDLFGRGVQVDGPTGSKFTTWTPNDTLMLSQTDENGVLTTYEYDQDGNQTSEVITGPNGGLFRTSSVYEREGDNGTIRNLIRSRTDRRGNTTLYDYDRRGNLTKITHPATAACAAPCDERFSYRANGDRSGYSDERNKRTTYFYDQYGNAIRTVLPIGATSAEYDERSRPVSTTDENGNRVTLEYDWLNRLIRRVNPRVSTVTANGVLIQALRNQDGTVSGGRSGVRTYEYDPNSNKTRETDEEGRDMVYVYDFDNRVIEERTEFTGGNSISKTMNYDANDNETVMTDYRGNEMTLVYDDANRVTAETYPENEQGFAKKREYTYDNTTNVLTSTLSGQSGLAQQVTQFEYDNLYRQTQITDAESGITVIKYDGNDNVIEHIDELGRVMQYDYDAMNRKVAQRDAVGSTDERSMAWQYDRASNLLIYTDARGNVETHAYDDKNRRIFHTNLDENRYSYEYDDYGNLTDEFDHFGNHIQYQYDALHRREVTIDQRGFESSINYDLVGNPRREQQRNGNVIMREFDFLNRVISEADSIGPIMSLSYDDDNNPLSRADGKGFVTAYRYDALSQLTEERQPENRTLATRYDVYGNVSQRTDGEGNVTRFEYDRLNRNTLVIDALNQTIRTAYDPVDNVLRVTDKRGNTTEQVYDQLNRVVQVTEPEAGDHSRVITNQYDANDNLIETIDKRGIATSYDYDRLNRVVEEKRNDIRVVKNTYSEIGDLIGLEDANGNATAMEFNERHEMVLESRPETAISTYTYDAMGDRISMRDPEGRVMSYGYDLRQRKVSETNGENETTTYTYDLNNNQIDKTRPEGNQWQYRYDELNRLLSITDANSQDSFYAYDRQNNLTTQTDANSNVTRYEYDVLNRKSLKRYPITAQGEAICTYEYDPNDNVLVKTDANGQIDTHTYDALNRLTNTAYTNPSATTGRDMVSESMAYDGNNNVTQVTETYALNGGGTEVRTDNKTYDDFDRLFNRTDSFDKTIRYRYDLNGNRTDLTDSLNRQ